jgi:hypothetical protein
MIIYMLAVKGIMKKTYLIFASLILLLVVAGCDHKLKAAINSYSGDGQIKYLEAPGLLGTSGCSIKMPSFDLSEGINTKYSLSGIPANENYVVYLVVKDPVHIEQVQQVFFSYQIKEGENIIAEVSAPLKKFVDGQGGGLHRFYFWYSNPQAPYVSLGYTKDSAVISVSSKNQKLAGKINAYIEISFGGFK